jgi:hypothetical protein
MAERPVVTVGVPNLSPGATAAMKEDLAAYRVDRASGESDLPFENWLKATRPERWEVYLKLTNQ